jgi:Helix-turn-helix family
MTTDTPADDAPAAADARLHRTARRIRGLVEPLAAAVYFAPEAQQRYEAMGLNYFEGYFCSRSACLGAAPWRVVSGAFAAFKPAIVERAVTGGWAKSTPEALLEARLDGARDQYARMVGEPDAGTAAAMLAAAEVLLEVADGLDMSGRPLFAGLAGLPVPDEGDPLGRLWRASDLVREHRGDGHIAAWISHVDATEITVLTELWWGIEPGSYVWTRGWDGDDVAEARARLAARGLLDEAGALTAAGRDLREEIEKATDRAERVIVERLGDRADELLAQLTPWSQALVGEGGYPADVSAMFG